MRRLERLARLGIVGLAVLLLAFGTAACGSDEPSTDTAGSGGGLTVITDSATAPPAETEDSTEISIDACSLPTDAELGEIFAGGAPAGDGNDFGEGFGACTWENDAAFVSVSIVPGTNFQSDFVDQLNVTGPVVSPALGDGAVSFPGLVGIGSASGGGATVGFTKNDAGLLVAVRTGAEGGPGDLASATKLAEGIAGRL